MQEVRLEALGTAFLGSFKWLSEKFRKALSHCKFALEEIFDGKLYDVKEPLSILLDRVESFAIGILHTCPCAYNVTNALLMGGRNQQADGCYLMKCIGVQGRSCSGLSVV